MPSVTNAKGKLDNQAELSTQRIEAFSDGVFAIAITLLILNIGVPHVHGQARLGLEIWKLWPSYFAYLVSFIMVGIYWSNHHYVYQLYKRVDHQFLLLNVFFLLCISFLPFPTAVLAEYMTDLPNREPAASFYSFGLLLPALSWGLVWMYASKDNRLLDETLDPKFVKLLSRQYMFSTGLFLAAFAISFSTPVIALCINVGLTVLYMLPPKRPVYLT